MRITMKFVGGPYDGDITFDDSDDTEAFSRSQKVALNYYMQTDCGVIGAFCMISDGAGGTNGAYHVHRTVDGPDGCAVYLRARK
jgi:hypothetical protein